MAKIPGIVYVLIGLFVGLVSYFSKNPSLKIFVYIGFGFGVIGIAKLFIGGFSANKGAVNQHTYHKKYEKINKKEQSMFTKYCQRCGNIVRVNDIFCSRCGNALHRRS